MHNDEEISHSIIVYVFIPQALLTKLIIIILIGHLLHALSYSKCNTYIISYSGG